MWTGCTVVCWASTSLLRTWMGRARTATRTSRGCQQRSSSSTWCPTLCASVASNWDATSYSIKSTYTCSDCSQSRCDMETLMNGRMLWWTKWRFLAQIRQAITCSLTSGGLEENGTRGLGYRECRLMKLLEIILVLQFKIAINKIWTFLGISGIKVVNGNVVICED